MDINVEKIFEKEDWKMFNKHEKKLKDYIIKSGLNQEEAQEIFEVISTNEKNRIAANRIGTQINELYDDMREINAKYKDPKTSDREAKKLAKQYRVLEKEAEKLDIKRNYFLDKFDDTRDKAEEYIDKLKSILVEKGYDIHNFIKRKNLYTKKASRS